MTNKKYCKRCKTEKLVSEFYEDTRREVRSYCISCSKQLAKNDYARNKGTDKYTKQLKRNQDKRLKNPEKTLYDIAKQRAKKRNLEFQIDIEDIVIPIECPVLQILLKHNTKGFQPDSPSIDRIDNTKGYIKNNIQVISNRANILKKDITIEELEQIINFYEEISGRMKDGN